MINHSISEALLSRHTLTRTEFSACCVYAEKALKRRPERTDCVYHNKETSTLSRALLIDYKRKRFTICSKKLGPIFVDNGLVKKVSAALEVQPATGKVKEVARLVNKADQEITRREIGYEARFGEVRSHARYTSKKDVPKTTYTQRLYTCDFWKLVKKQLSFDLEKAVKVVARVLGKMHSEDVVHGDLKAQNMLYSKKRSKIADFGHARKPKVDERYSFYSGYATSAYTAPEHLAQNEKTKLEDETLQAKADDCFALGCVIYELAHKAGIPWGNSMEAAVDEGDMVASKKADETIAKERHRLLVSKKVPYAKLIVRLLDPLPKNRLTIPQLMEGLDPKPKEESNLFLLAEACSRPEASSITVI